MSSACGVIFDMDGVLIDSTEAHYEAWRRTGEWVGKPYPRDLFDKTFGMNNRQSVGIWIGSPISEEKQLSIAHYKERVYQQIAEETLLPIPGALSLVEALAKDGFRLAIGSSAPADNVHLALRLLEIGSLFQALSCGDEVAQGKPDPAIFLNAARKLGLEPAKCAVIEDAPPGIEAARRGGMAVIALPTSRPIDQLSAADLVIHSLDQLTPSKIEDLILKRTVA